MGEESKPPIFVLIISPQLELAGKVHYGIRSENTGVPDELVTSMMEAWLRGVKDEYFNNIRSGMSF